MLIAAALVALPGCGGDESSGEDATTTSAESSEEACLRSWNEAVGGSETQNPAPLWNVIFLTDEVGGKVFIGPYEGPPLDYEGNQDELDAAGNDKPDGVVRAGDCWVVWPATGRPGDSFGVFFLSTPEGWFHAAGSGSSDDYQPLLAEIERAASEPNAQVVYVGLPVQDYPENGTLASLTDAGEQGATTGTVSDSAETPEPEPGATECDPSSVAAALGEYATLVGNISVEGISCEEAAAEIVRIQLQTSSFECSRESTGEESSISVCTDPSGAQTIKYGTSA
jgi:hypothetical protein